MLAEQAEMKGDKHWYFIFFFFPFSESLWRVCVHACLHVWAFRCPWEQGNNNYHFPLGSHGAKEGGQEK